MLAAVTGINWGDEGKGRVIDLLAENADAQIAYAPCAAEICSFPKTIHHALFIRCLCIPKGVA